MWAGRGEQDPMPRKFHEVDDERFFCVIGFGKRLELHIHGALGWSTLIGVAPPLRRTRLSKGKKSSPASAMSAQRWTEAAVL